MRKNENVSVDFSTNWLPEEFLHSLALEPIPGVALVAGSDALIRCGSAFIR
jgi:hypothetical protein